MKKILIASAFILLTSLAHSQLYQRLINESAESFSERILKVNELIYPVIETNEWDSSKKVIFAFILINSEASANYNDNELSGVTGYCLIQTINNTYQKVLIDTFFADPHIPQIVSVFFVNLDKDKEKEIAILVRTKYGGRYSSAAGAIYHTYFYDNPNLIQPPKKIIPLPVLDKKFPDCIESDPASSGTISKCNLKDEKSIRGELKRMGY